MDEQIENKQVESEQIENKQVESEQIENKQVECKNFVTSEKERNFLILYGHVNSVGNFTHAVTNCLSFDFPSREKVITQIQAENSKNKDFNFAILSISEIPLNW